MAFLATPRKKHKASNSPVLLLRVLLSLLVKTLKYCGKRVSLSIRRRAAIQISKAQNKVWASLHIHITAMLYDRNVPSTYQEQISTTRHTADMLFTCSCRSFGLRLESLILSKHHISMDPLFFHQSRVTGVCVCVCVCDQEAQ